jgi:hypothetical protein
MKTDKHYPEEWTDAKGAKQMTCVCGNKLPCEFEKTPPAYNEEFIRGIFENPLVWHIAVNRNGMVIGTTTDWICRMNISGSWARAFDSEKLLFGFVNLSGMDWKESKRTNTLCVNTKTIARLEKHNIGHYKAIKQNERVIKELKKRVGK